MIKLFEEYNNVKYKKGDFVILLEDDVHARWRVKLCVKIIKLYFGQKSELGYYVSGYYYNGDEAVFWVDQNEIDRFATPDEIEEFEIFKDSNKYNI